MLTLKQINEISFRKSNFSGYKPEDVDKFIDEVTESFTALLKENQAYKAKSDELAEKNKDLKVKVVALVERLEKYRNDEKEIKDALINAQKLSEQQLSEAQDKSDALLSDANQNAEAVLAEAQENAEKILEDARAQAEAIVNEATNNSASLVEDYSAQIETKKKQLDAMSQAVEDFRSELFEIYRNHIDLISNIPQYTFDEESEEGDAEEGSDDSSEPEPQELDFVIPAEDEAAENEVKIDEIDTEADDGAAVYDNVMNSPLESHVEDYVPGTMEIPELDVKEEEPQSFDSLDLDLGALTDIPEDVRNEKEALYQTLHLDEDLNL